MKPKRTHGGGGQKTPEREVKEEKVRAKNKWRQIAENKVMLSCLFTIGVFVIGTILLGKILHPGDLRSLITDPIFILFTGACLLAWFYSLIIVKSMLRVVNKVLWIILVILGMMLVVPWGWEKAGNFYHHLFPKLPATPHNTGHVPVGYDDSDSSFLEKGSHEFAFTDSGAETRWLGVKKDVRKWGLDVSNSSQNKLMLVFSDGDTIKTWEGGRKEIWGKQFKMVSLAPMEEVVLSLD